jgi:hypothetical protein
MKPPANPTFRPVWLSPIVGALALAIYFSVHNLLDGTASELPGALVVWVLRDLALGYLLALPVLALLRRLGASHFASFWAAAALAGGPMGYVLANPRVFAWSPTETQFQHGPYWSTMLVYMVLFGLSGLAYSYLGKLPPSAHVA